MNEFGYKLGQFAKERLPDGESRYEVAIRLLGAAIENGAPRALLDRLQAEVIAHRPTNLGQNMVAMQPFDYWSDPK